MNFPAFHRGAQSESERKAHFKFLCLLYFPFSTFLCFHPLSFCCLKFPYLYVSSCPNTLISLFAFDSVLSSLLCRNYLSFLPSFLCPCRLFHVFLYAYICSGSPFLLRLFAFFFLVLYIQSFLPSFLLTLPSTSLPFLCSCQLCCPSFLFPRSKLLPILGSASWPTNTHHIVLLDSRTQLCYLCQG